MGIIEKINSLEDVLITGSASKQQILDAQKELEIKFSKEYILFLEKYGSVLADGVELVGIAKSPNRNVIAVTKRERELNKQVPRNCYVIENLGIEGIIIWQDESGKVYQSSSSGEFKMIANSLEDYLNK